MFVRTSWGFTLEVPLMLYDYKVIELIGDDRYSAIFKVQNINTQKYYRAKVYSKKQMQNSLIVKMIHNEIHIHRMMDHPNICKLYEYFNIKNEHQEKMTVLIEKYYPRGNLKDYVKIHGFTNENEKRKIEYGIIQAVDYLHQKQIVHLNIRPENIYLDDDMNPKLSCFSASRNIRHKYDFYDYSYHSGIYYREDKKEFNYLSPEYYECYSYFKDYYYKSDLWSIGILLFYMTERRLPFKCFQEIKKKNQIIEGSDKEVMRIIRQCINVDRTKRPDIHQLINDPYFAFI